MKQQKDLSIHISNNLHPRYHIQKAVNSALKRIGLIKRCFTNRGNLTLTTLYTSLIRPVIEYGSPVWAPWHKKDIQLIDKVQAKFSKLTQNDLNFEPLSNRRNTADLVEVYKYLHGLYKSNSENFFSLSQRPLRGHSLKLNKSYSRTDVRKYFFSNRVVDPWNRLPEKLYQPRACNNSKDF